MKDGLFILKRLNILYAAFTAPGINLYKQNIHFKGDNGNGN
jgi:hypothetical protein